MNYDIYGGSESMDIPPETGIQLVCKEFADPKRSFPDSRPPDRMCIVMVWDEGENYSMETRKFGMSGSDMVGTLELAKHKMAQIVLFDDDGDEDFSDDDN